MKRKKVLFLIQSLGVGGAERFLISLVNNVDKDYIEPVVVSFSLNNPLKGYLNEGIKLFELGRKTKLDLRPVFQLRLLLKSEQPDIIFAVNFFSFFLAVIAALKSKFNGRIFISYHSTELQSLKSHILQTFYTKFLKSSNLIITVSENQKVYTAKRYNISPSLFKTVYNGVDPEYWNLAPDDTVRCTIRHAYDIPKEAKVIVITAGFRKEKNHVGAIQALRILHSKHNEKAYLLLVGDGAEKTTIERNVGELCLGKFVKFAGFQSDVRPFYWAADAFSLTSTAVETFSIAALEAMACGLPVALTRIGGADEMVIDGLNGFLSRPNAKDIAKKWLDVLNFEYDKNELHDLVSHNYSLKGMICSYENILST